MEGFVEVNLDPMYLVSAKGEVFSKFSWRLLKLSFSKGTGYSVVNIRKDGIRQPVYVHRLVAEAFIPNTLDLLEVNHKNGIKTDNWQENLEWVTGQENKDHAVEFGLTKRGQYLPQARLNDAAVHEICALLSEGKSCGHILRMNKFTTNRNQLLNIRARRDWQHISQLYEWEAFSNKRNSKAK